MRSSQIAPADAPFYSLQKRLRLRELTFPELDNQNRELFNIPSQIVQRESFMADRSYGVSEEEWTARRIARQVNR